MTIAFKDAPRIGSEIGVGEDVIHAIIDVEARPAPLWIRPKPLGL